MEATGNYEVIITNTLSHNRSNARRRTVVIRDIDSSFEIPI